MQDLHNNHEYRIALAPVATALADDTPQVTTIVDRLGFDSLELVFLTGTLADAGATFTLLLEHGDASNLSDAVAVPDDELLGTEAGASLTQANDSVTAKLGYTGTKRYVRGTLTPSGNGSAAPLAALWHLGHPQVGPLSTQIV